MTNDWAWPKEKPVPELAKKERPPSKVLVGALLANGRDSCSKSFGKLGRSFKEGGKAFWKTLKGESK